MPQYNNSIENALKILSLFTQTNPRWRISEIARKMDFSKTTTFNIVSTLEKNEILVKVEEGSHVYELGSRIISFVATMVPNIELNQKGAAAVQELSTTYGFLCRMGIWYKDTVIIIFAGYPQDREQFPSYQAGPRVPGYSTAIGRAILAYMDLDEVKKYLDQIRLIKFTPKTKIDKKEILEELEGTRKRGFSIDDGEMVYGDMALGAPIFNSKKYPIGAIALVGTREKVMGSDVDILGNAVSRKAFQISQTMGYQF